MYPQKFINDSVFKGNRTNLISDFYKWLPLKKELDREEDILHLLNFNVQIDKQKEVIKNISKQLKNIEDDMNKDLSPYKWKVVENIDNYKFGSVIVKAEYGLLLDS